MGAPAQEAPKELVLTLVGGAAVRFGPGDWTKVSVEMSGVLVIGRPDGAQSVVGPGHWLCYDVNAHPREG